MKKFTTIIFCVFMSLLSWVGFESTGEELRLLTMNMWMIFAFYLSNKE